MAALTGCAHWSPNDVDLPQLPIPKMSGDSVVLEIIFVPDPRGDESQDESLWKTIDEQQLSVELRRKLKQNGFRIGVIGGELPATLRESLREMEAKRSPLDPSTNATGNNHRRMLQNRAGRKGQIVCGDEIDEISVAQKEENAPILKFEKALCSFGVRTFPKGDGQVSIDLTPEIEYGDLQQRWVGNEGSFHLDASKTRKSFNELLSSTVIAPGQTLLVARTGSESGLGEHFFRADEENHAGRNLLMIRLAQTQLDDLFAPGKERSPISTIVD